VDFWKGARIRLRGIEPADADTFFAWNHDSEMARRVDQIWFPASREFVKRWAEKVATQAPEGDVFYWLLEDNTGQVVGSIDTHHCDRRTGVFSYGITVREEHRRKGYASEAIVMVLRYFFEELRYQKATISAHSYNGASIRLHERLGFQLEGRVRRTVYTEGRFFDELLFGMTREEFQTRYPGSCALEESHS
jgi:RimJ/RimL family protein N-acetyltransferase